MQKCGDRKRMTFWKEQCGQGVRVSGEVEGEEAGGVDHTGICSCNCWDPVPVEGMRKHHRLLSSLRATQHQGTGPGETVWDLQEQLFIKPNGAGFRGLLPSLCTSSLPPIPAYQLHCTPGLPQSSNSMDSPGSSGKEPTKALGIHCCRL